MIWVQTVCKDYQQTSQVLLVHSDPGDFLILVRSCIHCILVDILWLISGSLPGDKGELTRMIWSRRDIHV